MFAPGKIDGIFYNANDKEICLLHSFSVIRFDEHVNSTKWKDKREFLLTVSMQYQADRR